MMLRLEPQVTADLDRGPRKGFDDLRPRAFEFHDVGSGLDRAAAVHRRSRACHSCERANRRRSRFGRAAAHGADMVAHVGEGDVPLAGIAQHIGADAVADENDVDAGGSSSALAVGAS